MTIISRDFGGVTLTGEDAIRFQRQLKEPPPQAAIDLVRRASQMKINEDGSVTVPLRELKP